MPASRQATTDLLDPAYLTAIANYALLARIAVEGFLSGLHRSLFHGFGSEFLQYRAYSPGEDPRYIDWKAFARRERLQTKVYQEETNMNVLLVLDASASLDYQGSRAPCSKFRYASMLCAAIAYMAARQGDKVGLTLYSDTVLESIPPGQRNNRMASLYHALAKVSPSGTSNHAGVAEFLGHQLRGRGVIVFISDMLDAEQELPAIIGRLRIRHYDSMALQVLDPDELDFPQQEAARFVDMETGGERITSPKRVAERFNQSMRAAHEVLRTGFTDNRIDYRVFSSAEPFGTALSAFLHHRNQFSR